MTELDEIVMGKTIDQLVFELAYQIETLGESLGGEICGHITHEIEKKRVTSD